MWIARALWLFGMLLVTSVFFLAIPIRQRHLDVIFGTLSPAQELVLQELGVSPRQHAGLVLAIEVGVPLLFLAVALLIFWRRGDDWVAMLISLSMVYYIIWGSPVADSLPLARPDLLLLVSAVQALGVALALTFFYIFPDGRLVPRWTRFILALWCLWAVAWVLMPGSVFDFSRAFHLSLTSFLALMAWLSTGLAAQIFRFARHATPVQRQQTKLVMFGTTVAMLGYLVFGFNRFAVPILDQPLFANVVYDLVGVPIFLLMTVTIPLSFTVSLFRYRLWETDMVINRALVYGTLTAFLAGLYTASVAFSQRAFVALTGERSDAAIVLTTLIVASAFTPVKARLQTVVDRYVKPLPDPMKEVQGLHEQIRGFVSMMDVESMVFHLCDDAARAFGAGGGAVYLMRGAHYELAHTFGDWSQMEGMSASLRSESGQFGWVTLTPRVVGPDYSEADIKLFTEMVTLAGRAMTLVRGMSVPREVRAA